MVYCALVTHSRKFCDYWLLPVFRAFENHVGAYVGSPSITGDDYCLHLYSVPNYTSYFAGVGMFFNKRALKNKDVSGV